jgi:CDP-2,3-bis-(O-geranylgeranyl)-sn-glycerol synthase
MHADTLHLAGGLLLMLLVANGAPILLKRVFRARFAQPIDGGLRLADGQPLLGSSKTWRGLVGAVLATTALAPIIGFTWASGACMGAGAMLGDLLSSFIKRRLRIPASGRAPGLDQVPEALVPLWLCGQPLGLGLHLIALLVLLFMAGEIVLSRWLYRLGIRDRPY